jgi:hypothetical protein
MRAPGSKAPRPHAKRLGVSDAAGLKPGFGGIKNRARRRLAGLADLHVDDIAPGRFQIGGSGHDIHDNERVHGAAGRGRKASGFVV